MAKWRFMFKLSKLGSGSDPRKTSVEVEAPTQTEAYSKALDQLDITKGEVIDSATVTEKK
jgi:hypothetical protein